MKLFGGETVQAGVSQVRHQSTGHPKERRRKESKHQESKQTAQGSTSNDADKECGNCGSKHLEGHCPALGRRCNNCRKLNYGLEGRVKVALDEMCYQGVIVPADHPTDWVNVMVAVERKNTDKLRICIDPRPLNKAIKREHYYLPTIERITTRVSGAKYFSMLDTRSGFWQIPLDGESSLLTTFSTVFSRYRFTRLPFGIHSAQEVFHKRLHELLGDLPGVETDIDDILVWGRTQQEHDESLVNLLQQTRECNLKLNPDKSKIRQPEVLYIGHVLTGDGVRPDTSKIEAITKMPKPEDKQGVQRLLGMVKYVAKLQHPYLNFSRKMLHGTGLSVMNSHSFLSRKF